MTAKRIKQTAVPLLERQEDPGLPGGGKGRVDATGVSQWKPPEGTFPPGEGYEESGSSGVMLPDRFADDGSAR